MKKFTSLSLCALTSAAVLVGCGDDKATGCASDKAIRAMQTTMINYYGEQYKIHRYYPKDVFEENVARFINIKDQEIKTISSDKDVMKCQINIKSKGGMSINFTIKQVGDKAIAAMDEFKK